jgi:thimet oligopeptidase
MHNMCTQAEYGRFSGTAVERDFVEAPSQMFENWCYESDILARLSGHYQRPDEKLPDALRQSIVAAKNADTGLMNLYVLCVCVSGCVCVCVCLCVCVAST